jgi:hypothetical protein
MANTQSITVVPGVWKALPDVVAFTFTNTTSVNVEVRVAASLPAATLVGRAGSHILKPGESMNRFSLGVHYVYCSQARVFPFSEDDS